MKAKNWILSFVTLAMGVSPAMAQQTGEYAKMNKFIDNLMSKMTLQEKLGQLNLPVTGEIVTGQAKSSDVAGKIKRGEVGGLFNLKGVKNIKEVQKIAVEQSRLKIPLLFGMDVIHGYETVFPIPFSLSCSWDMEAIKLSAQIAAQEASADGINWTFSPMLDICRDSSNSLNKVSHEKSYRLLSRHRSRILRGVNSWQRLYLHIRQAVYDG